MGNIIIINSPLILVLYGIALALVLFELFTKLTGYVLPIIAFMIVIGTTIYSLLIGAQLFEVAIYVMIFLLINLFGARRKLE